MNTMNIVFLAALTFTFAAILGWGENLYKLAHLDFKEPLEAEIVRIAGVFVPPVGVVAGYITFDEEKKPD